MYQQSNPYFATGMVQQPTFYNPNMQQPIQQTMPSIRGKIIDTPNDIAISDVPGDGSTGVFPSRDGNHIITKTWAADGSVKTEKYLKEKSKSTEPLVNIQDLLKRVEALERSRSKGAN